MRHRTRLAFALLLSSLPFASCSSEGPPEIKPASSVDVPKKDDFDRDAYCTTMCDRSTACGLEQATLLAGKVDKTALERATADREATQKDCVTSCGKSQLPPYRLTQAKSALACTKRETCDAFATCLEDVASK